MSSSKQASKAASSSGLSSNKAIGVRKSLSYSSVCSNSRFLPGISKFEECRGKRKRISSNTDLKSSQKPVDQRLEKYNFGSSLEKHNSDCSKDSRVQLEDISPPDSDFLCLTECVHVEENDNSLFSNESKGLPSCTQSDGLVEAMATAIPNRSSPLLMSDKPLAPSTEHNGISKIEGEKAQSDTSALLSENSSEPPISLRDRNNFLSKNTCENTFGSLHDLNEPKGNGLNQETSVSNRRCLSDSEDEISDYNLDSSDDEEVLLPFEEIMAQVSRPPVKSPERTVDVDDTRDTMTSLQDILVSG